MTKHKAHHGKDYGRLHFIFVFLIGFIAGCLFLTFFLDQNAASIDPRSNPSVEEMLRYTGSMISGDNFHCEGIEGNSVGSVIGSMIRMNGGSSSKGFSYRCEKEGGDYYCMLSVSHGSCFMGGECGDRILRGTFNASSQSFISSEFSCIDVP